MALELVQKLAEENRAAIEPQQAELLQQRAIPALFIVDPSLAVIAYREDPLERRGDCRMASPDRLPPLVEDTVRELLDHAPSGIPEETLSAAPNRSLVVRVLPLQSPLRAALAVVVERLKWRDQIRSVAQKYALSSRECEVLALLVRGLKNQEIADHLHIAPTTAIFHVKRLMVKMNSRNRTHLVAQVIG